MNVQSKHSLLHELRTAPYLFRGLVATAAGPRERRSPVTFAPAAALTAFTALTLMSKHRLWLGANYCRPITFFSAPQSSCRWLCGRVQWRCRLLKLLMRKLLVLGLCCCTFALWRLYTPRCLRSRMLSIHVFEVNKDNRRVVTV